VVKLLFAFIKGMISSDAKANTVFIKIITNKVGNSNSSRPAMPIVLAMILSAKNPLKIHPSPINFKICAISFYIFVFELHFKIKMLSALQSLQKVSP